jgi:hypothetical protein
MTCATERREVMPTRYSELLHGTNNNKYSYFIAIFMPPLACLSDFVNYGVSDGVVKVDGLLRGSNCNCSGYSRPAVLEINGE